MSTNRLFLYDPVTHTAVCIAKGYSAGWSTHGESSYQNKFFEGVVEYTGSLSPDNPTRLQVHTEDTLPSGMRSIVYAP